MCILQNLLKVKLFLSFFDIIGFLLGHFIFEQVEKKIMKLKT